MSLIFPRKPQILYAPMLGTFGGGSATGLVRAGAVSPTGPDPFSSFAVSVSGENSLTYTEFDNQTLINNMETGQITGLQYWHRLQLSPTLTGVRRIIFRTKLPESAKNDTDVRQYHYHADVQIAGVIHRSGPATTKYYFTDAQDHGFETIDAFSTGSGSNTQPTTWKSISTTQDTTAGEFCLKVDGAVTSSDQTGRLVVPSPIADGASTLSYMYSETTSPVDFGDSVWMRSPAITINAGDIIEVMMGEDAVAAESFTVEIQ